MSISERLTNVFRENDTWPSASLTFEQNTKDLKRHEAEFLAREAFACAIFSTYME